MTRLRVLDLCAGLGGLSSGFRERGHDVITLDYEPGFNCNLTMDVREFAKDPWRHIHSVRPDWTSVDVIVTGPPCEGFSVLTIGRNWTRHHQPKTDKARLGVELVRAVLEAIRVLQPQWWWMENPRGKLRKLPVAKGIRRITITYCQYGALWQKPTDLWGQWPPSWRAKPMCTPRAPCHVSAPRGSRKGIQGVGYTPPAEGYGTVQDPRGGSWVARHPAIMGGRRTVEGDLLDPSLRIDGRGYAVTHPAGVTQRAPGDVDLRRPTDALDVQGVPSTAPPGFEGVSGTAAAIRAEAPKALSLSFALACEAPAPHAGTLDAFAAGNPHEAPATP